MPAIGRWDLVREIYKSRIGLALQGLLVILLAGTCGFYVLGELHQHHVLEPALAEGEHWSFFECFYFATITLTTVGYGETVTASGSLQSYPDVRFFTATLLLAGMIGTAYFLSSATAFFVEGDLKRVLERRRMLKTISSMGGHYLICGAGQTGRHICEELAACQKECVVIDADPRNIAYVHEHVKKIHSMVGDATRDETLLDAGIERAAGLAAVLPDDKDNLFLTISARQLNPKLRIISKAVDMPTRAKLLKAGADGVVASNYIGGLRMASELIRPAVVNFLDQMLRGKDQSVRFAEVRVGRKGAGKTLRELDVPRRIGLLIIAVRNPGVQNFIYNPGPDVSVVEGATLVVMGEVERVGKLEDLVGDARGIEAAIIGGDRRAMTGEIPMISEEDARRALEQEEGRPSAPPTILKQPSSDPRDNV